MAANRTVLRCQCRGSALQRSTRHSGRARNWNVRYVFRLHGLRTFRFSWFFLENSSLRTGCMKTGECNRPFFVISLHSLLLLTTGSGSPRDANAASSIPSWKSPVTTIDVPPLHQTQSAGPEDKFHLASRVDRCVRKPSTYSFYQRRK